MTATLLTEDKALITHYLIDKGDITLWSDYENKRFLIENELPHTK